MRAGSRQWSRLLAAAVVVLAVTLVAGTGVGPVTEAFAAHGSEEDFENPEVTEITREGATRIEMRMSDNHDVDEGTIDASDFEVDGGTISKIEASEDGSDAVLNVSLEDGVGNQALTIQNTSEMDITDKAGNEFAPEGQFSEVVPAADNPPSLNNASRVNVTTIEVTIVDDSGVDTDSVDADDFVLNRSSVANVSASASGTNASVKLRLESGPGTAPLSLGLSGDADIKDVDGTVIENGFRDLRVGGLAAPTLQNISRISTTEIGLYFTDDEDVEERSFQPEDFQVARSNTDIPVSDLVSGGGVASGSTTELRLARVNATERGSDARVVLELATPTDRDEVFVSVRDSATIVDTHDIQYDPTADDANRQAVLTGMDGVAPDIESFTVSGGADGSATLRVVPTERLGGLAVSVGGPVTDTIDLSSFEFNRSSFTYRTTYTADAEGSLRFDLVNATDRAGNTRELFETGTAQTDVDRSGPDPVVAIDFRASENLTLVFDGRHTTDITGVSSYTWTFDDDGNATGERVTRTFRPGTHTVTLTAVDTQGRSGTTSVTLDLAAGAGDAESARVEALDGVRRAADPDVQFVTPGGSSTGLTLVEVGTPSPGVPVAAPPDGDGPLAASSAITVERIEMVPDRYGEFTLGVSASAEPGTDAADATGNRALGGFSVVHDVPDGDFQSVELTLRVDADRLDSLGADPADVTVLRQQGDTWEQLETTPIDGGGDGSARFRVESPGLSRFGVVVPGEPGGSDSAATPTPTPTDTSGNQTPTPTPTPTGGDEGVVVTAANLSRSTVEPGETVFVNATLENRADGNTRYTAGLSVNGSVVGTDSVTLPAGENRTVSFQYVPNETGTYPVAVNDTTVGELTVGGGGVLASVLGIFDPIFGLFGSVLGFFPLGLLRPLVLFVLVPVLVVVLVLKGLALYLGY